MTSLLCFLLGTSHTQTRNLDGQVPRIDNALVFMLQIADSKAHEVQVACQVMIVASDIVGCCSRVTVSFNAQVVGLYALEDLT